MIRIRISLLVLSVFLLGCEESLHFEEAKSREAMASFSADTELNSIQKIMLFEYIMNEKLYSSYDELRNDYGDIQVLIEEEIVNVQSSYNAGNLSLYVDTAARGNQLAIHGIIISDNRLSELRGSVKRFQKGGAP